MDSPLLQRLVQLFFCLSPGALFLIESSSCPVLEVAPKKTPGCWDTPGRHLGAGTSAQAGLCFTPASHRQHQGAASELEEGMGKLVNLPLS